LTSPRRQQGASYTKTTTFRQWFTALTSIIRARSPTEQRKLDHDSAVRVYKVEEA
jgi:hypothetical protein